MQRKNPLKSIGQKSIISRRPILKSSTFLVYERMLVQIVIMFSAAPSIALPAHPGGPRGSRATGQAGVRDRPVPAHRHREARLPRRPHGEAPPQDGGERALLGRRQGFPARYGPQHYALYTCSLIIKRGLKLVLV
jgi:hypothetical protein